MKRWEDSFRLFFNHVAEPLAVVLKAHGCREGWLQGKAFRFFGNEGIALYTNYLTLPGPSGLKNSNADFAVYASHDDAAELNMEVYGETGFYPNNLTCGNLHEVRRRLQKAKPVVFSDCAADRQLVIGPGLLGDYFRLVDFAAPASVCRLLVLCVRRDEHPDEFGRALSTIEFERRGTVIYDGSAFWTKCWAIGTSRT
jgi:hypothetical protein